MDVNECFFMKIQKNGGGQVGGGSGWGVGHVGCERRIEVFVKIKKKKKIGGGRVGSGGGAGRGGGGGQGRCEQRS